MKILFDELAEGRYLLEQLFDSGLLGVPVHVETSLRELAGRWEQHGFPEGSRLLNELADALEKKRGNIILLADVALCYAAAYTYLDMAEKELVLQAAIQENEREEDRA